MKWETSTFIEKAIEIHGNKYDYSRTQVGEYKGGKVKIVCPKHGVFYQTIYHHIEGKGCKQCALEKRSKDKINKSKALLEQKIQDIYGDKYKINYETFQGMNKKIEILCQQHGIFYKSLHHFLQGQECPKCSHINFLKKVSSTTDEFIQKAKNIHGNIYDYSKVNYVNNHTNITIICKIHGEYEQLPSNHLKGKGCPYCAGKYREPLKELIQRGNLIHNNKYDYSESVYNGWNKPLLIKCPIHGAFAQTPYHHINRKQGCAYCSKVAKKTLQDFIKEANEKHNKYYDYTLVSYNGANTKIDIVCPKHGVFSQTPHCHLSGQGCPKCKMSHLECNIQNALDRNNIEYEHNTFLKELNGLQLDFYIPNLRLAIECQGEQHFMPKTFGGMAKDKAKNEFLAQNKRDKEKLLLCKKHGITLLYYTNNLKRMFFENEKIYHSSDEIISKIQNQETI